MTEKDTTKPANDGKSLLERPRIRILIASVIFLLLVGTIALIDLEPDLSHVETKLLTGSEKGNYFAIGAKLSKLAVEREGVVQNISTRGSMDNMERLKNKDSCPGFALVQDGLPFSKFPDARLIARLPVTETVFVLGKNAGSIRTFADLRGKKMGIGPEGSGTARLARQIFLSRDMKDLKIQLSNHSLGEQLKLTNSGSLDFSFIVIAENSALIDQAIRQDDLQIVDFIHASALSNRLPFLSTGTITAGFFDPVRVLPPKDKGVLKINTLLIAPDCVSRSETVSLLSLLEEVLPGTVNLNRSRANDTGLKLLSEARNYFDNGGPELWDDYAPRVVDWVPIGNLVHLVMVVSILFNFMGIGNRFRLWRIDATRVGLEDKISSMFVTGMSMEKLQDLVPTDKHRAQPFLVELDGMIAEFEELKERCRKHSLSVLVPMGQELGYRYQESLVEKRLLPLRHFRSQI